MEMNWLNRGVYPLLQRIGDFQYYFEQIAKYLAAICFFMALLMAVIKIFLGIADAREQVIKLVTTTVIYFILMFLYPIAMTRILPFAMNLGYGAVFYTQAQYKNDTDVGNLLTDAGMGKPDQFYKWLGKNTKGIFTSSVKKDEGGNETISLDLNVVDKNTGFFDLNKIALFVTAFLKVGFHLFPKLSLLHIDFLTLISAFFYALGILVVFVCVFVCLINYIMCLIDYYALMGFGILTIPLSLWDGTKSYTEKLYGSIGAILIKLMVISAFLYLAVMSIIDLFVEIYLHSYTVAGTVVATEIDDYIELTVTLIFQGFLLYVLTMNTEKISGFINGGSPSMSFGEAAMGAMQMGATVAGTKALNKGVFGAVGNAGDAVGGALAAGRRASREAGLNGESGSGAFGRSVAASLGSNVASSLSNGIKNAPGSLKSGAASFTRMAGMKNAFGSEGYTAGGGSGGGGSGSGGGSQGGNDSTSNTPSTENDKGVYGNAARTEDGKGYATKGDEMIARANSLATSHNYWDRQEGKRLGMAGNVMKSMSDARNERAAGDIVGNGNIKAMARGISGGIKGGVASSHNFSNESDIASGGMKMSFERNGMAAHKAGSDLVNYKAAGNQPDIKDDNNRSYSNPGTVSNAHGNQIIDNSDTKKKM